MKNHENVYTRNQPTNRLPANIKMAASTKTHMKFLIAHIKSVTTWDQKAFVNVIWSKFEGYKESYGFELIIAEMGSKIDITYNLGL